VLTRIYIDNFRTLVNFEWRPGKLALLLGDNGSGKSSVIEALWAVRALVVESEQLRNEFPASVRTRWESRTETTIELEVGLPAGTYRYRLVIDYNPKLRKSRISDERLDLDGVPLMQFSEGDLSLYRDGGTPGPKVTGDWSRSGLGVIAPGKDNLQLSAFKAWLREDLWQFNPDPRQMSGRTDDERDSLDTNLANFASFVPAWMTQDLQAAVEATRALSGVIAGFEQLQVDRTSTKLAAAFRADEGAKYLIDFEELSDGQRQLCALYFVRHLVMRPGRLIILDEPDNYVALREIQPWLLDTVEHALSPEGPQLWLISHHPELLDQLAPAYGARFYRGKGPTRVEPFRGTEGLTSAEVVARGWDGE
jgi:predicted ATPase